MKSSEKVFLAVGLTCWLGALAAAEPGPQASAAAVELPDEIVPADFQPAPADYAAWRAAFPVVWLGDVAAAPAQDQALARGALKVTDKLMQTEKDPVSWFAIGRADFNGAHEAFFVEVHGPDNAVSRKMAVFSKENHWLEAVERLSDSRKMGKETWRRWAWLIDINQDKQHDLLVKERISDAEGRLLGTRYFAKTWKLDHFERYIPSEPGEFWPIANRMTAHKTFSPDQAGY